MLPVNKLSSLSRELEMIPRGVLGTASSEVAPSLPPQLLSALLRVVLPQLTS